MTMYNIQLIGQSAKYILLVSCYFQTSNLAEFSTAFCKNPLTL